MARQTVFWQDLVIFNPSVILPHQMAKLQQKFVSFGLGFLSLIALSISVQAQSNIFTLEHIGLEEGLPARMVYQILQDKEGFIWFSTQLGIHRYDGHRFKTFAHDQLGLPTRSVANLSIDSRNRLWYSCSEVGGIPAAHGVLDLSNEQLLSIYEATGHAIHDSLVMVVNAESDLKGGALILMQDGQLYRYDQKLEHIGRFKPGGTTNVGIVPVSEKEYWRKAGNHITKLHRENVPDTLDLPLSVYGKTISVFNIGGNPILKYLDIQGTQHFKYQNGRFSPFAIPASSEKNFSHLVHPFKDYNVIAYQDSIKVFDLNGKRLFSAAAFQDRPSNGPARVHRSFVDRQSNLWIGTEDGLYVLKAKPNHFQVLFPGTSIYGILRTDSNLWIGGHPHLLGTGSNGQAIPKPHVTLFYKTAIQDSKKQLWLAVHSGGIKKYNPSSGSWQYLPTGGDFNPNVLTENPHTGRIWVGLINGVAVLQKDPAGLANSKLERLSLGDEISDMAIRQFHHNGEGIWAVGSQGLVLFDPETERAKASFGREAGFPHTDFNHLHEDADGIFWAATRGGGLLRWDPEKKVIRQFSKETGLSNDNIYAVYEDEFGILWLPSDYGLMAFDKATHNVRVYHRQNGIAQEEFNTFSHFRDADSTLYFGGLGGITAFHPRDFQAPADAEEAPLYVTKISVLDNQSDDYQDRSARFKLEKKIVLSPGDQALEIETSFLDFEQPDQNQLSYRLRGYQENWVYPDGEVISYMNLPYGSFTLEIRAKGASGNWIKQIQSIQVIVERPFYLKTWFILFAIALLILAIFGGVRWRLLALRRDRIRLEREVQNRTATIAAQAEELKALDKLKSNFFANITHEIRTPLTLLIGPLENLIDQEQVPSTRKSLLGIRKNARNLLSLLNQLLDISKLEHRQMRVEIARGDLKAFTGELLEQFRPIAEQKGLTLTYTPALEAETVFFDPDKWSKIIFNLVSNAVKFTGSGGSVSVTLSDCEKNDRPALQLVVADSGIGIPKEDQAKVFDRFYQADSSSTRDYGGTGIGLALVKELVDLQEGAIEIDSDVGRGTRFTLSIPIPEPGESFATLSPVSVPWQEEELSVESEEMGQMNSEQDSRQDSGKDSQLTLLLIEDDPELRRFIRSCLDETKYAVVEAADGAEGIEKALEMVPDLIISDVMMPRKNGFEVVEEIRKHVATSHIPLILLTAKASLESRLEGLRRGADAYLTKPFVPQELKTRIDKLIELRQLLRERYQVPQDPDAASLPPEPNEMFRPEDEFMERLKNLIQANLTNPDLKVDLLAKDLGLSRTQFYRKLSSLTDLGVSDLIRNARCESALELIRKGELNFSEIAYEVGYSSPGHFSRSFKKRFGLAPSEVMKQPKSGAKV